MTNEEYDARNPGGDDDDDDDNPDMDPDPDPGPIAAEFADQSERIAMLEAEIRAQKLANFAIQSSAVVDRAIAAGRLVPAQREVEVALRTRAMVDDLDSPVNFSSGEVARATTYDTALTARPAHGWGKDQITAGAANFGGVVLDNGGGRETDEEYARRVNARHNARLKIG